MQRIFSAQAWLDSLSSEGQFFKKNEPPSLDAVNEVLDLLGRPDESFEWRIVVGGTAGKGTTSRLIENTLLENGKNVALISSPHLQTVIERIRLNGKLIEENFFVDCCEEIKNISEKNNIELTYYEAVVLVGILAAKIAKCEILICEVGMGGSLDAVNSVRGKRISILTFVGEDHLEIFDNNIEKLAAEKAGIFTKDCVKGFSYDKNYCSILRKNSLCNISFVGGIKQKMNKKLARKACEEVLGNAFVMTPLKLPARWEKMPTEYEQKIILDGAHSAPKIDYTIPKIKKIEGRKIGILAMAKNHDCENFSKAIPFFDEIIWTKISSNRESWDPKFLQEKFQIGDTSTSSSQVLKMAKMREGTIVVLGSFYLCGEIRENFYPTEKIIEQQTEFPA